MTAARDFLASHGTMLRNQDAEGHLRSSPFMLANRSTSSLEGMERPVKSFRSFIRKVPPHPQATQKPLPPTPEPELRLPQEKGKKKKAPPSPLPSRFPSPSRDSTASIGCLNTPMSWYNSVQAPTIPVVRTASPLLPEPSPFVGGIERTSWLETSPPQTARLLPILERSNGEPELGPPRTPPTLPLPAPPTPTPITNKRVLSIKHDRGSPPSSAMNKYFFDSDMSHSTPSPSSSLCTSTNSSASTKEKAFASLGIGPPPRRSTPPPELGPFDADSLSSSDRQRADRQYLRGKKLRALNKGSPLADDSWEDPEMDDQTRQMSFWQDYHDLLADQYQEMNVHAAEVLSSGGVQHVYEAKLDELSMAGQRPGSSSSKIKDRHPGLVPRPLSWQKSYDHSPPIPSRNPSRTTSTNISRNISRDQSPGVIPEYVPESLQEKVRRRITSWVPHRLSGGSKRRSWKQAFEDVSSKALPPKHKPQDSSETKFEKALKDDLRFSKFFPPGKPLRLTRKPKPASPSVTTSHTRPLVPLFTPHRSPPPTPQKYSPESTSDHSPRPSPTSNHRSSWNSVASHFPVAPGIAIRGGQPPSRTSSYSHSSSISLPTHPLAYELTVAGEPPIHVPGPSQPPAPAWPFGRAETEKSETHGNPFGAGIMHRAKQARRKYGNGKETRQERLKKSIRVLGPTDPTVVGSYVRGGVGDSSERMEDRSFGGQRREFLIFGGGVVN